MPHLDKSLYYCTTCNKFICPCCDRTLEVPVDPRLVDALCVTCDECSHDYEEEDDE